MKPIEDPFDWSYRVPGPYEEWRERCAVRDAWNGLCKQQAELLRDRLDGLRAAGVSRKYARFLTVTARALAKSTTLRQFNYQYRWAEAGVGSPHYSIARDVLDSEAASDRHLSPPLAERLVTYKAERRKEREVAAARKISGITYAAEGTYLFTTRSSYARVKSSISVTFTGDDQLPFVRIIDGRSRKRSIVIGIPERSTKDWDWTVTENPKYAINNSINRWVYGIVDKVLLADWGPEDTPSARAVKCGVQAVRLCRYFVRGRGLELKLQSGVVCRFSDAIGSSQSQWIVAETEQKAINKLLRRLSEVFTSRK
jgi:hypothetical protein